MRTARVRPAVPGLVDRFGRVATDLRVSLTDRCNLRCTYCMPEEGLAWLPKETLLTDAEVVALVRVAVERLGVTEVRFTGGEPLLRPGLVKIVGGAAALAPRPKLSVTTNGIGLARLAAALAEAGLDRVNVSLDTLRPDRFERAGPAPPPRGRARGTARRPTRPGLRPVKLNAVLMRGVNDDEAVDLLTLRPGARLRAAVHRADAAGRPARLAARGHGGRRGDPGPAAVGVHPAAGPDRAGRRAGRDLAGRRARRPRTAGRRRSASSPA